MEDQDDGDKCVAVHVKAKGPLHALLVSRLAQELVGQIPTKQTSLVGKTPREPPSHPTHQSAEPRTIPVPIKSTKTTHSKKPKKRQMPRPKTSAQPTDDTGHAKQMNKMSTARKRHTLTAEAERHQHHKRRVIARPVVLERCGDEG